MATPDMNPTGQNYISASGGGAMLGPGTGGPGNVGWGNSGNPNPTNYTGNPYMMMPPQVSMNPGSGAVPTGSVVGDNHQVIQSPNTFGQTQRQENRTLSEMQKYYGEGMGSMLYQYLQSGGGYNSALTQQAVDAQTGAMQHQIMEGGQNIMSMLGAEGISPNSSAAALEMGDYMTQAVAQENSITAQEYFNMWNASQNREESMLQSAADVNQKGTANEKGWMDYLNMGLGMVGDVVGLGGLTGIGGSIMHG